jgi:hypothetical protein
MPGFMYIYCAPNYHPMKQILAATGIIMISIISAVSVKSQELKVSDQTKKYTAENAIAINLIQKDTLFKRTLKWLHKEYPNSGKKGTFISTVGNDIVARQYFNPDPHNLWNLTNFRIGFLLTFEIIDRKVKYNYTDFYYFSSGNGKVPFESQEFQKNDIKIRDGILDETNKYIKKSITSFAAYIQNTK